MEEKRENYDTLNKSVIMVQMDETLIFHTVDFSGNIKYFFIQNKFQIIITTFILNALRFGCFI